MCAVFPLGTDFLWHLLIPVSLYLLMRGLLLDEDRALRHRAAFRSNDEFLETATAFIARLEHGARPAPPPLPNAPSPTAVAATMPKPSRG